MASRFWWSPTHSAGQDPSPVVSARVVNVNLRNWTVDVVTTFDRHFYRDIQVISPYLHYNNGEGFYVMPDLGAMCMVTIPGDSSPMYVSGFLAPMTSADAQQEPEGDTEDAVTTDFFGDPSIDSGEVSGSDAIAGTRSRGATPAYPTVDARFDAGRPSAQTGTQYWRGRDGNFVILHRGGVLQIGASELAQRIYLPLDKIFDVCKDYEFQNIGGCIRWGIQDGAPSDNPTVRNVQTYRVFANDRYADVRVTVGKVNELGEPDGDAGERAGAELIQIGKNAPIVCEVAVAAGGFDSSGFPASSGTRNASTFRFLFDRDGKVLLRAAGKALFSFFDDLTIKTTKTLALSAKFMSFQSEGGIEFTGKSANLSAETVRLGSGTSPVARMGDSVQVVISTALVTGTLSGNPFTGTLTIGQTMNGVITGGNPNVRALYGRTFYVRKSSWCRAYERNRHGDGCGWCNDIAAHCPANGHDIWGVWARSAKSRSAGTAQRTPSHNCGVWRSAGSAEAGHSGDR